MKKRAGRIGIAGKSLDTHAAWLESRVLLSALGMTTGSLGGPMLLSPSDLFTSGTHAEEASKLAEASPSSNGAYQATISAVPGAFSGQGSLSGTPRSAALVLLQPSGSGSVGVSLRGADLTSVGIIHALIIPEHELFATASEDGHALVASNLTTIADAVTIHSDIASWAGSSGYTSSAAAHTPTDAPIVWHIDIWHLFDSSSGSMSMQQADPQGDPSSDPSGDPGGAVPSGTSISLMPAPAATYNPNGVHPDFMRPYILPGTFSGSSDPSNTNPNPAPGHESPFAITNSGSQQTLGTTAATASVPSTAAGQLPPLALTTGLMAQTGLFTTQPAFAQTGLPSATAKGLILPSVNPSGVADSIAMGRSSTHHRAIEPNGALLEAPAETVIPTEETSLVVSLPDVGLPVIASDLSLSTNPLDAAAWEAAVDRLMVGFEELLGTVGEAAPHPAHVPWLIGAGLTIVASEIARRARSRPTFKTALVNGSMVDSLRRRRGN